jgi:hypothetical protein
MAAITLNGLISLDEDILIISVVERRPISYAGKTQDLSNGRNGTKNDRVVLYVK